MPLDLEHANRVGKSSLEVTPLGFGAGPLADPQIDVRACLDIVDAAWSGGVRFYDSAPYYGIGRSERRLGLALSEHRPREAYQVNTKVGRTLDPEPVSDQTKLTYSPGGGVRTPRDRLNGHRVRFDYTADAILGQHRDSLNRLGMPYVDSLTIHDVDYGHQWPEQVELAVDQLGRNGGGGKALEELRRVRLVKAIGAGCNREMRNYDSWNGGQHEDLIERLADVVDLDFLILAGCYTLLDTIALRRLLPLMRSRSIGAIVASPFAGGWLINPDRLSYMYGETPEPVRVKTERIAAVCREHEAELGAVALQFALAHPAVAAIIPGARSAHEAREARRMAQSPVPTELWSRLKRDGLLEEDAPTPDG
jgi:D-threo-aldose 1-dehydrogenase